MTYRSITVAAGAMLSLSSPGASVEPAPDLPFFVGEQLGYRLQVAGVGTIGRGAMRVAGPVAVRGRDTYELHFEFEGRVGPVRAVDRTTSWLDPRRMAALRFRKYERSPLARSSATVELFPGERRWAADDGSSGRSPTDAPLDELSFIYFVRTLPLEPGAVHEFNRHFEAGRNPVTVRVLERETIRVGAGEFPSVLVEMRVRDDRRFGGGGVLRIHLSDDERRLPLRIESAMPVIGRAVLSLESHSEPPARHAALYGR